MCRTKATIAGKIWCDSLCLFIPLFLLSISKFMNSYIIRKKKNNLYEIALELLIS